MESMTIEHETVILFIKSHLIVAFFILFFNFVVVPVIPVWNLTFAVVLLFFVRIWVFLLLEGSWRLKRTGLGVLVVAIAFVTVFVHRGVVLLADHGLVQRVSSWFVGSLLELAYKLFGLLLIKSVWVAQLNKSLKIRLFLVLVVIIGS